MLVSRRQGNIPYKALLPPLRSDRVVWYMEHASAGDVAELPPYALVLNAIGDADVAAGTDAAVEAFIAGCERPVLNRPARVRATARHRLGETLAGLPDVFVPLTARLSAKLGLSLQAGWPSAVSDAGLTAPVLIRPLASHGGQGLTLARDAAELAAVEVGRDGVYATAYHDCRSPDGFHRKYRMIFVNRRPYPYHLAIGRHWMVHHQNTDMAGDPARVAEELAFLSDPAAAIGEPALAAVAEIGRRLDLDYCGVDFTLTADGRVLVFEANATMLTHLEPEDGPFAAKNRFIRPIIEAFQTHLAAMASAG